MLTFSLLQVYSSGQESADGCTTETTPSAETGLVNSPICDAATTDNRSCVADPDDFCPDPPFQKGEQEF
jgi:hypothetical protein